jgi:hypothetical protein
MKTHMYQAAVFWLYSAAVATALAGLIYITVQQNYRTNANDPQIALAEDAAASLSAGNVPASVVLRGAPLVDIASSLSPWIAVYDSSGMPLEASGQLDNTPPKLPAGVFDLSAPTHVDDPVWKNNEYRFTWQPRSGVRQAVVLVKAAGSNYFVAAGRSLREVEDRESKLTQMVALGWLTTLAKALL